MNIVVLTGAGISAESGIKTFRDKEGLWEGHAVEEVATPEGFERNPDLVYRFYNERRMQLYSEKVKPNAAHEALVRLENEYVAGEVTIVTQNVDNLHERAGSRYVLHMHGELSRMRCVHTGNVFNAPVVFDASTHCPCCDRAEQLRPHIVWFHEMPFAMDLIASKLESCAIFLSIGTSGIVYPAADFVQRAHNNTHRVQSIELNTENTPVSSLFTQTILEPATTGVPKIVDEILRL